MKIRYVANLANLDLTSAEMTRMEKDLNSILEYIDQLAKLDTDHVEPMALVTQIANGNDLPHNALRADEIRPCLSHDDAMANAPLGDGTFFRVPKVIER